MQKIISVLFFLFFSNFLLAKDFHWSVRYDGLRDVIEVTGNLGMDGQQVTIQQGQKLMAQFEKLYQILEKRKRKQQKSYNAIIAALSKPLLLTFTDYLAQCDAIIVFVDEQTIRFPLEYLEWRGQPICLQKPMIFQLGNDLLSKRLHFSGQEGYCISNRSADPQRACETVHKLFPKTKYFKAKTIKPSALDSAKIDLLVISTHGYTEPHNNRGILGWQHEHFKADVLKKMNPTLTYFDACQQGINLTYLYALRDNRSQNFYVGPIISNDSGGSSTKTMERFFKNITGGKMPDIALFQTKKRLNRHYKRFFRHKIVRLSKANCFRVYVL